jgi:tetratricopeptide (TPR) repeat protein
MAKRTLPQKSKGNSGGRDGSTRRSGWVWLLVVMLAALAVKSVVLVQLGGHPLLQPHGELDTAYYVELAQKVARGGPLAVAEPFFVSPLYVFFLALVFRLTGDSLAAARIVQILLGAAAVALLYLTARQWFGEWTARIAAVLFVLTGFFTFCEILILQAALDPFLVSCTLYFISRTQVDDRRGPLIAAGISAGLFALNRPNALAYGLVAALLIAVASWRRPGRRVGWSPVKTALARASLYLGSLLLVLVPNALRNYAVSGEAILISSHGGLNFYIGNRPGADGTYQRIPGITPSIAGQARDATLVAEAAMGRSLSTGEVSGYFYRRAAEWIASEPAEALRLLIRKIGIVLNRTSVALNYSYAFYREDEVTLLRPLIIGPWLLVPLGLVGLFLRPQLPKRPGFWVWASFLPVYGLSVAAFFVSDRYRTPVLIPLCISSAATIMWLVDHIRAGKHRQLAAPVLAISLAAVLAYWDLGLHDASSNERTRKAVWLIEQGRYDEARDYVARITPQHAQPGVLRYQVGEALMTAGRYDDAIQRLSEAIRIDGEQAEIRLTLGQALTAAGRAAEAIPHLKAAYDEGYLPDFSGPWLVRAFAAAGQADEAVRLLSSFPDSVASQPDTAFQFGSLALQAQAPDQAERWLRIAIKRTPDHAEAQGKLGMALLLQNRFQEALSPLEAAVLLDPSSAVARLNLGVAFANLGRFDQARAQAQEALRLDPSLQGAAGFLKALPPAPRRTSNRKDLEDLKELLFCLEPQRPLRPQRITLLSLRSSRSLRFGLCWRGARWAGLPALGDVGS